MKDKEVTKRVRRTEEHRWNDIEFIILPGKKSKGLKKWTYNEFLWFNKQW